MSIQKFLNPIDFKKVIDDKIINSVNMKYLLKQRGILPICSSTSDLSELVYKMLFGSKFIEIINEQLDAEQNNMKSTVLIIKPKKDVSSEDYLQDIADEFIKIKSIPNTPYRIEELYKHQDENKVSLTYSYDKQQKGKISLIDTKKINLDVAITPINDKFKINIRHEGMSESKHFVDFIDKFMNNPDSKSSFQLFRVQLESLKSQNKVEFFDRLGKFKYNNWNIIDITNIALSKKDAIENFDSDENENLKEALEGISSAILSGAGLRQNSFVENCMHNGYIFLSMRFKMEHKTQPVVLEIDISFKQKDLKIIINKASDINEDGKLERRIMSRQEQNEYINYFQDVAYNIYSELVNHQNRDIK